MKLLFYTGSFTHQFYKEQYKFFPENIEIIPSTPELTNTKGIRKDYAPSWSEKYVMPRVKKAGLAAYTFLKIPKYVNIETKGADFVYAAQYLIKNELPYVTDFEHAAAYTWYNQKLLLDPRMQKKLHTLFTRTNLKYILPWTEAAKKTLTNSMDCSAFQDKIKVLYPAIEPKKVNRIKHEGVNMLFCGGAFYLKGGLETIKAFAQMKKNTGIDANLTVISNGTPPEIIKQYKNIVTFKSKITQEELDQEYCKTDLFVMPTHMDTFGYVFLEAMSYGIPCIGANHFAVPEIITHEKTGLIVPTETTLYDEQQRYKFDMLNDKENRMFTEICKNPSREDVNHLALAMEKLARNEPLRKKMSEYCLKEIKDGKFSGKKRIEELSKVILS